jgi:hypothetical protein
MIKLTTEQQIRRLTLLRHGDRKQGWDSKARARAVDAIVDHFGLNAENKTEAFLDFVITQLHLTPRKEEI